MNGIVQTLQSWVDFLLHTPVLLLLACALPLVLLAYSLRVFPRRALAVAAMVPTALTVAILFRGDVLPLIVAVDLAIAVAAAVDLFTLPRKRTLQADRRCSRIASLDKSHAVTLTITNTARRQFAVSICDDVPDGFAATPRRFERYLPSRGRLSIDYKMKASRRGAFRLETVYVRVRSRLGFWQTLLRYDVESIVHVYPDMQQLAEYAVLARTNRLSLMGVRRTRRIGQDNEFERLRDYTLDDNYKHIDWRATARRNKLTVKDFQASQSQQLIFLVDCGRMMTNESSGLSLLDHALNSMLMLSYVALRQGDSVGLICFSDQIHAYVPTRGGMSQMNHLLHASFDRFPKLVESRYDLAFLRLTQRCRKRSMVILMSNVIDEVNAHQVQRYLTNLVGRHLPLGLLLRDHRLFDAADTVRPSGEMFYGAAAAAEILTWRHEVLADLEHKGVLAMDVFPEDMTAPLVNQYLEIKARHLL